MTDSPQQPQLALASNSMDYWDNQANWAKPVAANQFTSGTQALNSMNTVNAESPEATGFAATNQGINGGEFNSASSVPNTAAGQAAASTASTTGAQNSSVGNTSAQTTNNSQTNTGNVLGELNALNGNNNSNSSNNANNSASTAGTLPSGIVSQGLQALGFSKASTTGLGTAIGNSINQFGADEFGLNAVAPSALSGAGVAAGASTEAEAEAADNIASFSGGNAALGASGASLTSLLGSAGAGAGIGSLLANITGENAVGSTIGGAIGGAAGGAILGAELGSVIPGLGTVIGAIGGSLLGGLFGPGKGTNASAVSTELTASGALSQPSYTSKNPNSTSQSFVQNTSSAFNSLAEAASQALGINFNTSLGFNSSYSSQHGGGAIELAGYGPNNSGSGWMFFDPSNSKATSTAYFQALSDAAQQSGYTDSQSLYNWFYGIDQAQTGQAAISNGITIAPQGTQSSGSISPISPQSTNSNVPMVG